mmetsp:Transcript_62925/g.135114  ORF Transcript_62925/g.135114 Transcript_62925/m.135114 type:complete len:185 (+) Transcript_62925:717-1271(+)
MPTDVLLRVNGVDEDCEAAVVVVMPEEICLDCMAIRATEDKSTATAVAPLPVGAGPPGPPSALPSEMPAAWLVIGGGVRGGGGMLTSAPGAVDEVAAPGKVSGKAPEPTTGATTWGPPGNANGGMIRGTTELVAGGGNGGKLGGGGGGSSCAWGTTGARDKRAFCPDISVSKERPKRCNKTKIV